jgi:hypothetical protein
MQTDQITGSATHPEPPTQADAGAHGIATEMAQTIVTTSESADAAMQTLAELSQRRRETAAELADLTGNSAITQRFAGFYGPTGALHHHGVDRFADVVRLAAAARAPLAPADRQFLATYLSPSTQNQE